MPSVKGVGEPCAGELHARFDGGWLETGPGDIAAYARAWKRRKSLAVPTGNRASRLPYLDRCGCREWLGDGNGTTERSHPLGDLSNADHRGSDTDRTAAA